MQQGMAADIATFDPDTVTDNATYAKGTLPTTGIPYVLVNGTIVVTDSKVLTDVNPGQAIRFEPLARRRFLSVFSQNANRQIPWRLSIVECDTFTIRGTAYPVDSIGVNREDSSHVSASRQARHGPAGVGAEGNLITQVSTREITGEGAMLVDDA